MLGPDHAVHTSRVGGHCGQGRALFTRCDPYLRGHDPTRALPGTAHFTGKTTAFVPALIRRQAGAALPPCHRPSQRQENAGTVYGVYAGAHAQDSGTAHAVISRADLIAIKRASGRPQDLLDVEALEESARRDG